MLAVGLKVPPILNAYKEVVRAVTRLRVGEPAGNAVGVRLGWSVGCHGRLHHPPLALLTTTATITLRAVGQGHPPACPCHRLSPSPPRHSWHAVLQRCHTTTHSLGSVAAGTSAILQGTVIPTLSALHTRCPRPLLGVTRCFMCGLD